MSSTVNRRMRGACGRYRRTGARALATAALTTTLIAAPGAATAQSATIDATCVADANLSFTPGLTLVNQPVRFTGGGSYHACVSPVVTGGTYSGSGTGNVSCLGGSVSAVFDVTWKLVRGGEATSKVKFETFTAVGPSGGVSLVTAGTVTEGLFAGSAYLASFAATGLDLQNCLLPGGSKKAFGLGVGSYSH